MMTACKLTSIFRMPEARVDTLPLYLILLKCTNITILVRKLDFDIFTRWVHTVIIEFAFIYAPISEPHLTNTIKCVVLALTNKVLALHTYTCPAVCTFTFHFIRMPLAFVLVSVLKYWTTKTLPLVIWKLAPIPLGVAKTSLSFWPFIWSINN